MIKTIYASELGKPVAKSGNYRAYKDGGIFSIYLVGREMLWNADNTDFKIGNKFEAVHVGNIAHLESFDSVVYELDCAFKAEFNSMKAGK